jgi:hypothetical protein
MLLDSGFVYNLVNELLILERFNTYLKYSNTYLIYSKYAFPLREVLHGQLVKPKLDTKLYMKNDLMIASRRGSMSTCCVEKIKVAIETVLSFKKSFIVYRACHENMRMSLMIRLHIDAAMAQYMTRSNFSMFFCSIGNLGDCLVIVLLFFANIVSLRL